MDAVTYTFVDKQDRSVLREGRSQGIGFAFCQRTENVFETIHPVSSCKDYLNDVVFTENTGEPFTAYGLTTIKKGIFTDKAYLAMGVLKLKSGREFLEYGTYQDDIKKLEKNFKQIEAFVNFFSEKFKATPSEIVRVADNRFVSIIDLFWIKASYRISLYALLARVAVDWDGKQDPMLFLLNNNGEDSITLKGVVPKIQKMIDGNIPETNIGNALSVHWHGICSQEFP